MTSESGRAFLNSYKPQVVSAFGRRAAATYALPPFIDGSIRREPNLQHERPAISCLCRGGNFAPRLQPGDRVAYLTTKGKLGTDERHRRLTVVLAVDHLFDTHEGAAEWYRVKGMPLPSNCLVRGNGPARLEQTHMQARDRATYAGDELLKRWEAGYQFRKRQHGRFVVCTPLFRDLSWNAPIVHDEDLLKAFGTVPCSQNPGTLPLIGLQRLLHRLGVAAPPSSP